LKKIVLVCHHFIPYTPAVGGVARVWYLADYLSKKGYEVLVLSSDGYDFGSLGFPELPSSVSVVYVPDPVKKIMQRQVSKLRSQSPTGGYRQRVALVLRRITSVLAFPDYAVFALPAYYAELRKIFRKEGEVVVIISAPSHSLLLLAVLFSRQRKMVKFIADYRDGWNVRGVFSRKGFIGRWLSRKLELAVCKSVDNVLFATNPMRVDTERLFPVLQQEAKSVTVMNGFPERFARDVLPYSGERSPVEFKIGHFGVVNDQLDSYRNIEPILSALALLRRQGFIFYLELYGDIRLSRVDISAYEFIRVKGSVSHEDALSIMRGMDCLLMYHMEREGASEVVTGKFFDYVSARRPILCVSPLDMEGALMVEAGRFGKVADFEDFEQICKAFLEIYSGNYVVDSVGAANFSRESQYSKILPLLN
jgi:glycosyltransferase involved in cell wall biosynthesis